MTTSNSLQDILTASKAAIDSITKVKKKAEDDYITLGKKTSGWLGEQAQGALKIVVSALNSREEQALKRIAAAEDRVLAAIEDLHKQSLAMIEAKTNFEIENIRSVGTDEEKLLKGFAQEAGVDLNLKGRQKE